MRFLVRRPPLPAIDERPDETSADLPYLLQFETFKELTTLSTAGAGLAVTLASSVLTKFSFPVWVSVVAFTVAALISLVAQIESADRAFLRQPQRARMRMMSLAAVLLIAIAIGALGSGVLLVSLKLH